jgi:2,4-dienoyl-CoA reductase-like NADH-dependent reductase (Old Yellow Enzyme family)/thioredoxin reductase
MEKKIEYLTKPGRIGKLLIRNRMVMAPMGTSYGSPKGEVTQRLIDYLEARAKGGAGLIVVESTLVNPPEEHGVLFVSQLAIWNYNTIPQWNELTSSVHFWGAKIFVQITHTGAGFLYMGTPGVQPVTTSPMVLGSGEKTVRSREATIEDIQHLVECYGEAALIAKHAGFDGVNIHCTHGYGIAGFQSGHLNKRTDQYGGSFDNRMRFGLEVLKRVKEKVGDDFPLTCRIPVDEFAPEGVHPEESVRIAQKYVEGGAHGIDLSCGTYGYSRNTIQSRYLRRSFLEPHLEMFKKAIRVPLIVAGSFNDPQAGEKVLREGKADFIAVARGFLADAEYAKKVTEGRLEDIRKCRRCLDGCAHTHRESYLTTDCSINVEVGAERKYKIAPGQEPKRVLIIGGGPAGMEVARIAALRGYEVTLFEKGDRLGGNMIPGSVPDFKIEDRWFIEWLSAQLKKLKVKVKLNREIRLEMLQEMRKYDVVIIATGATPIIPDIPGVDKALTAVDVLLGKSKVGKEVIIIGGGSVGCETALYLGEKGHSVKILEMLDEIALGVDRVNAKPVLMERMAENNVRWLTGMKVVEIVDKGVVCVDTSSEKKLFEGDSVVLAIGLRPANELRQALEEMIPECYAIGDCVEPRKVFQAIHEGSLIGRRI